MTIRRVEAAPQPYALIYVPFRDVKGVLNYLVIKLKNSSNKIIELAENFYEGLSEEEITEIEKIILDRSNFFRDRTDKIAEILEGVTDESMSEAVDLLSRQKKLD